MGQIKTQLLKTFSKEPEVEDALNTLKSTYKDRFHYSMNLEGGQIDLSSNRVRLTEFCRFKIFSIDNLLMCVCFILVELYLVFLLIQEARNLKICSIAKNLYKCIVLDIQKHRKVQILFIEGVCTCNYIFKDVF